jgi:outer membrane protein
MRILLVIAVIFGASLFNTVSAQKTKIGHLDAAKLMENLPERDSLANLIKTEYEKKQLQLQSAQAELERNYQAYMAKRESMDASLRALEETNLQNSQASLQQYAQDIQTELAQYEQDLLVPLQEKVKAAIKKVAEANNFAYILDSSIGATLYEGGEDVYGLVAKELGVK